MGTAIKGASLQARLRYVENLAGADALSRILGTLSSADRKTLQHGLWPSSLCDLELSARLDEAIAQEMDPENPVAVFRELGRSSADRNLRGVHKVFARGQSPHDFLSSFPSVRATYYSDGVGTFRKTGDATAIFRVSGATSQTTADCESTAGYLQRAIEILGGQNAYVEHPKCSGRGDDYCEFSCGWR